MKFKDLKNASYGGESKYWRPKDGANKIRIVSEAVNVWKVFDKSNKSVRTFMNEDAAKLEGGKEARMRVAVRIINRENGQLQIAEFGAQIVDQLADLATSEDFSFDDVPPYDITIQKSGSGLETEYKVIPSRMNTDLTENEIMMVKDEKSLCDELAATSEDTH